MRFRLLTATQPPDKLRADAIDRVWLDALRDIPTESLENLAWTASRVGPRLHVFGPWDMLEAWRLNLRGRDGKLVRGVSV